MTEPKGSAGRLSVTKSGPNYAKTLRQVGYLPRAEATDEVYARLGFKCGLEIHQQVKTDQKLFCRCPAGRYQAADDFDAEVIRHMRPTLSEMGEYDGTALMEKKTRKNIVYRLKNETACTYDIDDTPPFKINNQALDIALEIALMLKTNIVSELHVTRKQYLDGSIPTGFQRTGIIGIEGSLTVGTQKIGIIQLSLEEDACREVSDQGHWRVYTTDRLGMPLIEMVTYPEMLTPDAAAEVGQHLRMLARASGKVRTGIGAGRQDVNVSIKGGTRVEIKGVAHIKWIPQLTHIEAFRQKALLEIALALKDKIKDQAGWKISSAELDLNSLAQAPDQVATAVADGNNLVAVNLPGFKDILSFFTQPDTCFADEISDRLKVIACLEHPNLIDSENGFWLNTSDAKLVNQLLTSGPDDAQLLFWTTPDDLPTALETIEERCRLAFEGVPNETRKALPDGTTIFERVLPGPDRMYPDTDSAPISIAETRLDKIRSELVVEPAEQLEFLRQQDVPADVHLYLIRHALVLQIKQVASSTGWPIKYVACLFGHSLKGVLRKLNRPTEFSFGRIVELCQFVAEEKYDRSFGKVLLPLACAKPTESFAALVTSLDLPAESLDQVSSDIPKLVTQFGQIGSSRHPQACSRWVIGQLQRRVLGQVAPGELVGRVRGELQHV